MFTIIIFSIVKLIECCFGITVHAIGMFALVNHKKKTNQSLSLFSLSIVELFWLVRGIAIETLSLFQKQIVIGSALSFIIRLIEHAAGYELFLVMYILTADRLICIIDPLRHKTNVTRSRLWKVIIASWLVSSLLSIFKNTIDGGWFIVHNIGLGICALYIILVIVTYAIIIYKMRKSKREFPVRPPIANNSMATNSATPKINFRKEFLVPTLVIVSFLVCYHITFALMTYMSNHYLLYQICHVIQYFGLICDPLIYVILTKYYRSTIVEKCCCSAGRVLRNVDRVLQQNNVELGSMRAMNTPLQSRRGSLATII